MFESLFRNIICNAAVFRRPSVAYCSDNSLFPSVFTRTTSSELRRFLALPESDYATQLNQDIFALLVNRFKSGYFLEIGANDGFTLSNTIYLEEQFGWSGLLIEANPKYRDRLANRKAQSKIIAVTEHEGSYEFTDAGLYGGITDRIDATHKKRTRGASIIAVRGTTLKNILS